MRAIRQIKSIILVVIIGLVFSIGIFAQDEDDKSLKNGQDDIAKVDKKDNKDSKTDKDAQLVSTGDDDKETKEAKKTEGYYNNYLKEYRLGPQDIISIRVFQQCPDYCRTDAVVPPTARMSYPLIREGIFVGGKTVEEVQEDVAKKLEEYIIDPKVTVSLVRAGSARYAVMGKVNNPGVQIMDRRISINQAIINAGGIAKGGSRKKVVIARFNSKGFYEKEQVNLAGIEAGKIPTIFLKPGDQVFVGEKGFTWDKVFKIVTQVSAARILFGSPF